MWYRARSAGRILPAALGAWVWLGGPLAGLAESEKRADQGANAIKELTAARDNLQTRLTAALDVTRERTEAVTSLQNRVAELTARAASAELLPRAAPTTIATKTMKKS